MRVLRLMNKLGVLLFGAVQASAQKNTSYRMEAVFFCAGCSVSWADKEGHHSRSSTPKQLAFLRKVYRNFARVSSSSRAIAGALFTIDSSICQLPPGSLVFSRSHSASEILIFTRTS